MLVSIGVMLVASVITDIKTGKIPNRLICFFVAFGMSVNYIEAGWDGVLISLLGMVLPIGVLFVFFKYKVLGAGDIKLLMAMGAFLGKVIIDIMIYSFLSCGVFGFVLVIIKLIRASIRGELSHLMHSYFKEKNGFTKVPFSIFIALGFIWHFSGGDVIEI